MAHPTTRNVAILLTDIKGFTDKTSRKSRSDIQAMLDKHRELVLPILESNGGRLIKTIGDAFLMIYDSPTDAVLAGVAAQESLRRYNEDKATDDRIEVRIAINAGEVNVSDNDIFGEPVNITARIEGVAEAGEVFFTEAVYLAMNKSEVPSSEVGQLQLKGIPEKVRVYKVKREHPVGASAGPTPNSSKAAWSAAAPAPAAARPKPVSSVSGVRPTLTRRFSALLLDVVFCGILTSTIGGVLFGPKERPSRAALNVSSGEEDVVKIGPKALTVKDADTDIEISPSGVRIKEKRAKKAIYRKGGVQVSVDDPAHEKERDPFALFWVLYQALFLWVWSTTPGGKILGLRVVGPGGAPLDGKLAGIRGVLTIVSGYAALLGYLWIYFDKERKGWHDKWAGTEIVSA